MMGLGVIFISSDRDFPDFVAMSLLIAAAANGSTSMCRQLLAAGGDVGEKDEYGITPLLMAAYYGHNEVCKLLLAAGSDVGERKPQAMLTPLHKAAMFGHAKIIQLLLSHKADVNSRIRRGSTPL